MNDISPKIKEQIFDAVPTLQAENLVDKVWKEIENKIIPAVLFHCFTEEGIAETCGKILQEEIFYKSLTDEFYIKEHGQFYKQDFSNLVFYAIRQIGRKLNQLKYQFNGEGAEALAKALRKTTTHSGLKAIFTLLKSEPYLIRMSNEINPHGLLMTPLASRDPFTAVIVNRPGAVFTRCTAYDPKPGGVPTQFYKFLYNVFEQNNPEKHPKKTSKTPPTLLTDFLILSP